MVAPNKQYACVDLNMAAFKKPLPPLGSPHCCERESVL